MILQVYSVLDAKVGAYLVPIYMRSRGEAIRAFTGTCQNKESDFARFPEDYALYFLGEFDDSQGTFLCHNPIRVIGASEV